MNVRKAWLGWWVDGNWCPTNKVLAHFLAGRYLEAARDMPEGLYYSERKLWYECPQAREVLERLDRIRDLGKSHAATAERYTQLFHIAWGTVGVWQKRHHEAERRIEELEDALRLLSGDDPLLPTLRAKIARSALNSKPERTRR